MQLPCAEQGHLPTGSSKAGWARLCNCQSDPALSKGHGERQFCARHKAAECSAPQPQERVLLAPPYPQGAVGHLCIHRVLWAPLHPQGAVGTSIRCCGHLCIHKVLWASPHPQGAVGVSTSIGGCGHLLIQRVLCAHPQGAAGTSASTASRGLTTTLCNQSAFCGGLHVWFGLGCFRGEVALAADFHVK